MKHSILPFFLTVLLVGGPVPVLRGADDAEKKKPEHDDYRVFTAKNGKTLKLRVVARIDDETYRLEDLEGNDYTLGLDKFSASDQQFLEFWEPDAILDLTRATLSQVLEKMEYSSTELITTGDKQIITAEVGGTDLKFVLAANRNFSVLDPATATQLGLQLGEGRVNMRDAQGKTERTKAATLDTFTIGDVELKSLEFQVYDLSALVGPVPANTAGALGTDILEKLNAVIDLGGKQFFVKESD